MFELPIVRLYRSAEHAERALTALRRWGFEPERILQISPPTRTATTTTTGSDTIAARAYGAPAQAATSNHDDDVAALRAAGLPERSARHYADAVRDGYTLLVIHAPFGTGGHAEDLLEEGAPVAPEVEPFHSHLLPSNDAAPVSEALGLPTLARRGRTTSEVLGLPTLARSGRTISEALGIPALTRSRTFVASRSGLSDDPAPFSRLLHLPVLTRNGGTTSEALGIPTLARSRTFVASRSKLSDDPAPFSRLLHLPLLVRDRVAGRAGPRVARREVLRGDTSPSGTAHPLRPPPPGDAAGSARRVDASRTRGSVESERTGTGNVTRIG